MPAQPLTPGKIRRLQSAADRRGVLRILAVDHRGVLLKIMGSEGRGQVPAEDVTQFKLDVVRSIAPLASAVILDPQYGAFQAIAAGALGGQVGLLIPLDSNHVVKNTGHPTAPSPAWSVKQAQLIGASGVKLYLAYHPDESDRTRAQEELVREVVEQCAVEAMPLFLEPVVAAIDPSGASDAQQLAAQRRRSVVQTAERLGALGPDILKLQFPVDCRYEPGEATWRAACAEVNDAAAVPWALLSGGDSFERFKTQLQIACEAGCSGFMAGRALWNEAATASAQQRGIILETVVLPRMQELNGIAARYAHPWQEKAPVILAEEQKSC